ncbi:MAG: hypothetical protein AAFY39_13125 [Pseudomonadota bacterium]
MIEFVSSLSVMGWLLVALAVLTLWQLPAILRMVWGMMTKGEDDARALMPKSYRSSRNNRHDRI